METSAIGVWEALKKNALNYDQEHLLRSRKLRKGQSASERVLWERLRKGQLGFFFKRQVPVGPYSLDFYCSEASLCVEVDGDQHDGRVLQDRRCDSYLDAKGIETLRIPSLDLFTLDSPVFALRLNQIQALCESRAGRGAWDKVWKPKEKSESAE